MKERVYRQIELEDELQRLIEEGKTREEAVSIAISDFGKGNYHYLIEAYLMPIDEITSEIERYDSSNPKLDEIKFISELSKRYNVDRKAIIERIRDVRMINKSKELQTPERLNELKKKRDMLQKDRTELSNSINTSTNIEKKLYYLGLLLAFALSAKFFYPSSPILVALITMGYAVGVPTVKNGLLIKSDKSMIDELVDLDKEISFLEEKLSLSNEKTNTKESDECSKVTDCVDEYINVELNSQEPNHDVDILMSVFDSKEADDENSVGIDNASVSGPTLVKRK